MTDREIEQLEKDARRPNYGSKHYQPEVVLALIEELKKRKAPTQPQPDLFSQIENQTYTDAIDR